MGSSFLTRRKDDYVAFKSIVDDSLTEVTADMLSGIRVITDYAFAGCQNLESVTIPGTVHTIGERSFSYCSKLYNLVVQSGVQAISMGAFINLGSYVVTNVVSVVLPNSVTSIGVSAFNGSHISNITLPINIREISYGCFGGCVLLSSIDIPDGVTSIGESAFSGCSSLTGVTIPNSVTSIGIGVFRECTSLNNVTIPNSITSIPNSLFYHCTSLTNITLPTNFTSIGEMAFYSCGFTSITLPSSLISIGAYVFYRCPYLNNITIPSGVTNIGNSTFNGCSSLSSVTVEATTPPSLGSSVFDGTSQSLVIYVPAGSVETYKTTSGWSTYADKIQAIPSP